MRDLLSRLGNPERGLRCAQVAGTNGKGSTCRYLHRILQGAGLRTGLFTSPHLVCVRERFALGEEAISEEEFADLFDEVRAPAEAAQATYFETLTAMAALWYSRREAQVVVLETGLGGRLDSATAFPAEVCAVAQVGLDHTAILGTTVDRIWREKIAILRPGRPLCTLEDRPELLRDLDDLARERGGSVVLPDPGLRRRFPGMPPGFAQPSNLLLARACAEILLGRDVPDGEVEAALRGMRWPGRMERVPGAPEVVVDVGHNPDAARELARTLGDARPVLLYGTMSDKNWHEVAAILAPLSAEIHLPPLPVERAAPPEAVAAAFPDARVHASFAAAWEAARDAATTRGVPVLAFGSFHLAGALLRLLSSEGRYRFWPDGIRPDPALPGMG